jgi:hypothetical protein
VSGALRDPLERSTRSVLARPELQRAWSAAVAVTHEQVIALIKGKNHPLQSVAGGGAVLDLRPLAGNVSKRLGLPPSVLGRLPQGAGRIKVVRAHQLESVRTTLKWIGRLIALLILLVPMLVVLIVWSSRHDRRAGLLRAGGAVALGALIVIGIRAAARGPFEDALASTDSVRPAVNASYTIATSVLGQIAAVTLSLALILLLGAVLAGPGTAATRIRGFLRPVMLKAPEVVHGVVLGVLVLAIALSLVPGIARPLSIVLLLAACATATEFVRRAAVADAGVAPPTA